MQNTNIRPILHCGTAWLSDLHSSKEFIYHSTAASVKEKRVTQFVIWFLRRRALLGPALGVSPPPPCVRTIGQVRVDHHIIALLGSPGSRRVAILLRFKLLWKVGVFTLPAMYYV